MTKQRKGRDVHGILLFNKPVGLSSNAALQKVKRLFDAKKAGHTGSLDKLASGLLPICLGEATKLANFLLEEDKHYQVDCILGATTTTGDAEGDIIEMRSPENVQSKQLEQVIQQFTGTLTQVPPMYSALKLNGQPLYTLARQGKTVERIPRTITIYALSVRYFKENLLSLDVHCSKGTYIRTLVEDIGVLLGCGAYVHTLHRTQVGAYQDMVNFETLTYRAQQGLAALDDLLLPMHTALKKYPTLTLSTTQASYLRQGQTIQMTHSLTSGLVKLFNAETDTTHEMSTHFLGIGQILEDGRIAPKRLFNI